MSSVVDSWTVVCSLYPARQKAWLLLRLQPIGVVLISKAVATSMILLELLLFGCGGILGRCQIILKLGVAVMLVMGLIAVTWFGVLLGGFSDDVGIRGSCGELLIL